jgi:uncharacterized repeat protein (TIGR01451 family)/uncharacterized repeat protein (TIGR02543 family)
MFALKLLVPQRISKGLSVTLILTMFQAGGVLAPLSQSAIAAPAADRQSTDVGYRNPGPNSGDVPIEAGAYIIDSGALSAGASKQTVNQGLKQYGLVYELVKAKIPVQWIINPSKANVDVVAGNNGTDFSFDCMGTGVTKNYKSGAFIIPKEFATQAKSKIDTWKSTYSGLTIDGPCTNTYSNAATNNTVPLFATIKSWPRSVLDAQNGSVAVTYFNNAGIPQGSLTDVNNPPAYRFASPSQLTSCDDMYIMPHADPTYATHSGLVNFVKSGGDFYASCHAVSVIENMKDGSGKLVTNFLSETGTVMYNAHDKQGSPAYALGAAAVPGDPVAQFLGTTDAAMQAGSEQIFIPSSTAGSTSKWRATTRVLVYDQTQANVNSGSAVTNPNQAAAAILYGPAYGDLNAGLVMYQGGHSVAKGTADDVAAQRAFFNFQLLAAVNNGKVPTAADRTPTVVMTETATSAASTGSTFPVAGYAMGGSGTYRYSWGSTCSDSSGPIAETGSFAAASAASTTFTAPNVPGSVKCNLTLTIVDSCGRFSFGYQTIAIAPTANIRISQTVSPLGAALTGANLRYTAIVTNDGAIPGTTSGDGNYASDVMVTIPLPTGGTFNSAYTPTWSYTGSTPSGVRYQFDNVNNKVIFHLKTLGDEQTATITYELSPSEAGTFKVVATTSTSSFDTDLTDNAATNSTSVTIDTTPRPSLLLEKAPTDQVAANGGVAAFKLRIRNTSNTAQSVRAITIKDEFTPTTAKLSCADGTGMFWNQVSNGQTYVISEIKHQEAWEAACTLTGVSSAGTNKLSVTSATADSGTVTFNSSTANVAAAGDLTITKTGPAILTKGTDATYTITITNKSAGTKSGVKISDLLPAGLTVESATVEASNLSANDSATATVIAWDKFESSSNSGSGWKSGVDWTYSSGASRISSKVGSSFPSKYENYSIMMGGAQATTYNAYRTLRLSKIYKSARVHFECLTDDTRTATSNVNDRPNVSVSIVTPGSTNIVLGTVNCGTTSRIEQSLDVNMTSLALTNTLQDFQLKFTMGGTWSGTKNIWVDDVYITSGEIASDQFSDTNAGSWTKNNSASNFGSYLKGYATGSSKFPGSSSTYADGSFLGWYSSSDTTKTIEISRSFTVDTNQYAYDSIKISFACNASLGDSNTKLEVWLGNKTAASYTISKSSNSSVCGTSSNRQSSNMKVVTLDYPSSLLTAGRSNTLSVKFIFKRTKKDDTIYLDDFFMMGKELGSVQSSSIVSWNEALNGPGGNGYSVAANGSVKLTFAAHVASRIPESYLAGLINIAGVTSSTQTTPTYATVFTPFKASSIALTKSVNKKSVLSGETVTVTYTVWNPGNDTLTAVSISDPDCLSMSAKTVVSGNGGTDLQPGERWTFTCVITVNSAKTGTATATGTNSAGDPESAESNDDISVASASMTVSVSPATKKIYSNSSVTYTYTVNNTGNVELYKAGLTISSSDCVTPRFKSGDDNGDGNIDPEETWIFICTSPTFSSGFTGHTVVAYATSVGFESAVTSNTATYNVEIVEKPRLYITKSARDSVSGHGPATSIVVTDSNTVTYTYTVTIDTATVSSVTSVRINDTGCNVSSTPLSGDTNNDGIFQSTETWVFECTAPKLSFSETSTASAAGTDGLGNRVQSSSVDNFVDVQTPEILLTINPNKDYILYNENVTYTYKVKNIGGVDFTAITPTDPNCSITATLTGGLAVGQTWTFTCIRVADTATLLSEFNVTGIYGGGSTYQPPQANYNVFVMDPRMTIVKLAQVHVGTTNETRTAFSSAVSAGRGDKIVFKYQISPNEGPKAAPIPGINALILNAINDADCDVSTFRSLKNPDGFNVGDANGSGAMDKGEIWEYTCTAKASVTGNSRVNGETVLSPVEIEAVPASEATGAGPGASIRGKGYVKHYFTAQSAASITIAGANSGKFTVKNALAAILPKVLYVTDTSSATVTIDGSLVNHQLSYNANGGSGTGPDAQVGSGAQTLASRAGFTRAGYAFAGWSETSTSLATSVRVEGSSFTLGSTDVIMYAIWYATITYDLNGDDSGSPAIVDSGKYLPGSTATTNAGSGLTRAGATFEGWNTAADGSGTSYDASSALTISGDVTLYARWRTTLSYAGNGNTSGTYPAATTAYNLGSVQTVLENTGNYSKSGNKFLGWQDANGVDYYGGDSITLDTFTVLTAQWTALPTFNVTYDSDSATAGSVPLDLRNYLDGDEVTVRGNTGSLTKTGYTFSGWSLASTNYSAGSRYTIGANVTFVAVWTPDGSSGGSSGGGGSGGGTSGGGGSVTILPKVTLDPNYSGPTPTYQSGNGTVTLLPNAFKRPGFIFKGWSRLAAGPVQILDGGSLEITSDLTLYAIWEEEAVVTPPAPPGKLVTINLNSNCSPRVIEKQTNAGSVKLNSNTFTCPGSAFAGWSTTPNGAVEYLDMALYNFAAPATLYAVWIKGVVAPAITKGEYRFEVFFGMNSVVITSAEKKSIASHIALIKKKSGIGASFKVMVEGWVQPNPKPGNIKYLSTYRAKNVAAYMRTLGLKATYKELYKGLGQDNLPKMRHASVIVTWTKSK